MYWKRERKQKRKSAIPNIFSLFCYNPFSCTDRNKNTKNIFLQQFSWYSCNFRNTYNREILSLRRKKSKIGRLWKLCLPAPKGLFYDWAMNIRWGLLSLFSKPQGVNEETTAQTAMAGGWLGRCLHKCWVLQVVSINQSGIKPEGSHRLTSKPKSC